MVRDEGRGVVREGLLDDYPRVDRSAVDGAEEEVFNRNHAVLCVEENATEDFVRLISQLDAQECLGCVRVIEGLAGLVACSEEFERFGDHVLLASLGLLCGIEVVGVFRCTKP